MKHEEPTLTVELHEEENLFFKGVRIMYPNLWTPGNYNGQSTGYDALLLVPKSNTEAVKFVTWYLSEVANASDIQLSKAQTCVQDADKANKEPPQAGCYLIRPRSPLYPPEVYDPDNNELIHQTDQYCYSGSYCNVLTRGFGRGKKGSLKPFIGLNPLLFQHVADGDRIGGVGLSRSSIASALGGEPKKADRSSFKGRSSFLSTPEDSDGLKYLDDDIVDDDIPF